LTGSQRHLAAGQLNKTTPSALVFFSEMFGFTFQMIVFFVVDVVVL